jgi:hypothetical protein
MRTSLEVLFFALAPSLEELRKLVGVGFIHRR